MVDKDKFRALAGKIGRETARRAAIEEAGELHLLEDIEELGDRIAPGTQNDELPPIPILPT